MEYEANFSEKRESGLQKQRPHKVKGETDYRSIGSVNMRNPQTGTAL
jgi:hypothetical protein